jgi:excisionase family DNA binding protein
MLLKPKQVAALLNISTRTVHRNTKSGAFKGVKVGSQYRYPLDQFSEIIDFEAVTRKINQAQEASVAAAVSVPGAIDALADDPDEESLLS